MDLSQIVGDLQNFIGRDVGEVIDDLQKLFTILAIIVGGIWAYFNFFKGRTYRPRLEPQVSGKVMCKDGTSYVVATVRISNVGLSKLDMQQKGSGLRISSYEVLTNIQDAASPRSESHGVFSMFQDHQWIEPGETIEDQHMVAVPGCEHLAFLLEYRIVSKGITWKAKAIVDETSDPNVSPPNSTTSGNQRESHGR